MRAVRLIAILWVVLFASGVSVARAGVITAVADPVGPGCTGAVCAGNTATADIPPSNPNNDDVNDPAPSDNTIAVTETFTAIAPLDVVFTVANSTGTTEYLTSSIAVNNGTGFTWIGFHWELIPAVVEHGLGLDFDLDSLQPEPNSSHFMSFNTMPTEDHLVFSNGTATDPSTVFFEFSIDVPDNYTTFTLRGTPTVVPEPASLLLLGSGLAGLGLWRRRHS
jgi:hypothetical protein